MTVNSPPTCLNFDELWFSLMMLSGGELLALQDLSESLESNDRLVVGNLMTSLVDPQEVQVSNRLELPIGRAINSILSKRSRLELSTTRVVEVVDHQLGSIPVADPIQIAGPNEHVDAALHNLGQWLQERPGLVTSGNDFSVRASWAFAVGALSANGFNNGGVGQVVGICLWGVGRLGAGGLGNIVDVEVVGLFNGALTIISAFQKSAYCN